MASFLRGGLYGLLNALIVGVLIGVLWRSGTLAVLVTAFGVVPGIIAGSISGVLAGVTARQPMWVRNLAVLVPAHLLLLSVTMFGPIGYGLAIVPTTFLALRLEQQTRGEHLVIPRAIAI
jgi:ABC-type dipeptide/oligopeptide/nickel transport system permease subunit